MQNFVFVLDTTKKPLNPVHPGQARRLLKEGKAAVQLPDKKFDVHPKYLGHIHRNDGYNYAY